MAGHAFAVVGLGVMGSNLALNIERNGFPVAVHDISPAAVDAFLDSVQETLVQGDSVTFTGFGKFSAQQRNERQGVNPRTGERVTIAAAKVPKFSAGSQLKSAVKGG